MINYLINQIFSASSYGYLEIVKYLIGKSVNVNEIDLSSQTALHMAAESGYQEIVEILLANGASIDAAGGIGRTALHFGNSSEFFFVLLNKVK